MIVVVPEEVVVVDVIVVEPDEEVVVDVIVVVAGARGRSERCRRYRTR